MLAQGVLSWVGQAAPGRELPRFEARLYDKLFRTSCVADTGDDWLEDLNPHSLTAVEGALATPRLAAAAAGDKCVPSSPSEPVQHAADGLCWPQPLSSHALSSSPAPLLRSLSRPCKTRYMEMCPTSPGLELSGDAMPSAWSLLLSCHGLCCSGSSWRGWVSSVWTRIPRPAS